MDLALANLMTSSPAPIGTAAVANDREVPPHD
jgi:hypothetical protein